VSAVLPAETGQITAASITRRSAWGRLPAAPRSGSATWASCSSGRTSPGAW
jgi:hypothetical protein